MLTPALTPTIGTQMMQQVHGLNPANGSGIHVGQSMLMQNPLANTHPPLPEEQQLHRERTSHILQYNELNARMDGLEYKQDKDHDQVLSLAKSIRVLNQKVYSQ